MIIFTKESLMEYRNELIVEFLEDLKKIDNEEEIYFMPDLRKKWESRLG